MMIKFLTVIVVTLVLFINILPLSALARSERQGGGWLRGQGDGRGNVWVDTSRWETRRVQVEAARAARYEDRTVLVSPARTETRVIPEVRENRTRWIPPVTERRWIEVAPSRPAVSEQGYWVTDIITPERTETINIPAVTAQRRVITRPAQPAVPEQGYWASRTIPAVTRTDRVWVVTQAARPAQYTWRDVVITPGRAERRWIPPVTREERFWDAQVITHWERVRVSNGWWGVELREQRTGNLITRIPFPIWNPPVYRREQRVNTTQFLNTRTVVVTPGRNETVWIPPVTESRRVQTSPAVPEQGRWENRTVVVTSERIERVWVVTQAARPAVSEQGHWVTDIITPARTETRNIPAVTAQRRVITRPAQPGSPAVWDWRDVVITPGRNETYSVVIAPSTVDTDHIPAVTRVDRVQVEAARPARYEDRAEFVRDGRNENFTGNVTLERDRMYVFTGLRRPPGKTHDMVMNVKHNLNVTVTNITAVHVIDRFRGLGQMHVVPVSSNTRPDGSVDLNFNYTRPGTAESTLYVRLHLANGGFVEVEADIPVNGLTFTERSNAPPLRLDAAVAKEGTLGF